MFNIRSLFESEMDIIVTLRMILSFLPKKFVATRIALFQERIDWMEQDQWDVKNKAINWTIELFDWLRKNDMKLYRRFILKLLKHMDKQT
jgi:hypothetical protein